MTNDQRPTKSLLIVGRWSFVLVVDAFLNAPDEILRACDDAAADLARARDGAAGLARDPLAYPAGVLDRPLRSLDAPSQHPRPLLAHRARGLLNSIRAARNDARPLFADRSAKLLDALAAPDDHTRPLLANRAR